MSEISKKNKNALKDYIYNGDFEVAYEQLVKDLPIEKLDELLLTIAWDDRNIIVYTFACYLISRNDFVDYHYAALSIMVSPLCHINGAYDAAHYHIKKMLEIDPGDICAREMLLFLAHTPTETGRFLSIEKERDVANELLNLDPQNEVALRHLAELNT